MKLSAMLILFELGKSAECPEVVDTGMPRMQTPVSGIRIYDRRMSEPSVYLEDVLYIAEAGTIDSASELPACLLAAGIPSGGTREGVVYIGMPFVQLANFIENLFYEYNKIEEALNTAISRNESLRTVLNICARFFNNPITINDMRMRFVETSDNVVREQMPDYLKVVLDTGYIDIRVIVAVRNRGYEKLIISSRETVLIELEEIPARYFTKNIYDGGQITAGLVIHEVFSPIDIAQTVIVDQVAQVIDCFVYKSPSGKLTTLTKVEQCINDLIAGNPFNEDIHAMHLRQIGWDVEGRYYLIKVEANADNVAANTALYTFAAAQSCFPGSLIVEKETYAVIVVCVGKVHYDLERAIEALRDYLMNRQDKAAISRQFSDFRHICEHYNIVSATLELGTNLDPEKSLYDFQSYVLPVILKFCSRFIDLRVFCSFEATKLQEYDRLNDSDLFKSLYVYLKHNRSLAAASRELNIHRNTLLYRLGRVSEITGLDPGDDAIYLPMILSYEILHYRLKLESAHGLS